MSASESLASTFRITPRLATDLLSLMCWTPRVDEKSLYQNLWYVLPGPTAPHQYDGVDGRNWHD
ncbi:hypothetical protein BGW36DRAFT_137796 [Talaromyces proteolyticus]|uniref:Uncharacterized protein n=1 Tax=Talaromyces proteolyticus TaxID=1131652 RepID=A0AAD4KVS0_9EURO|nr:uncharacterized protein BGW36DRAFT_137796 [Talaromyces proteolyticus]KAH8700885.1 hypothetical protein BGW36DRAFT_137796 [Talaromyces proteolyticus]